MNCTQLQHFDAFLELLKAPAIRALLIRQPNIDKYSLAACFVYFLRAKLDPSKHEFSGKNFALGLYVDNMIQVCILTCFAANDGCQHMKCIGGRSLS